jgi:hypothetical protein
MMSMTSPRSLPMTPIAAITLAVGSAEAQYIDSATWDSSYGSYGAGPQTCARLRFQGSGGEYQTGSEYGQLSAVCYRPGPGEGTFVDGCWSSSETQGWLSLMVVRDGSRFDGCWGFGAVGGPASGYWNGSRASVPSALVPPIPSRDPRWG